MPTAETCLAHNDSVIKDLQNTSETEWVTSGPIGTREAVLVFRTSILNPKTRKSISAKSSAQSLINETTNAQNPSVSECKQVDKATSRSAGNITSIANATLETIATTNIAATTIDHQSSEDWQLQENTQSPSPLQLKNNNSRSNLYARQRKIYVSVRKSVKLNQQQPAKSPFLDQLHDSLSSSDNSISSEGYESQNADKKIIPNKRQSRAVKCEIDDDEIQNETCYDSLQAEDLNDDCNVTVDDDLDGVSEEDYEHGLDMPAHQLKITYKFYQTETKLLRKIFNVHGLTEVSGDDPFNILWTGVHMKLDVLRNLAPYQRVNHFPRSYELTRKDRLYKNIERMQHLRGMRHFDIVPQSFILPLEYKDLMLAHNKQRGPWIVKPAASSRGRGIFIVNSPDQIPQDEQVLVSKYIIDPLCIDGHKCDLRVYVLVTSFDPLIIYIYEEGLVRLATVKYDRNADNLWNPCMHLCNYSINKYHSDYIRSSDAHDEDVGHKWTLSALLRHLKMQGCDTRLLMHNIEDLIIKSILACAQTIISACRMFVPNGNNCFELYGFDILIDDSLKPWLLEVNLSPSMGVDSPLDTKVKASLITDLLTCVGIPAYGPEMRSQYDSKWSRFRSVSSTRRIKSSEAAAVVANTKKSITTRNAKTIKAKSVKVLPLTLEEQRILRNTRLQYARRAGFVRIFPTDETMQRYGHFLDPASGIPISTSNVQNQTFHSPIMQHNYNLMLHSNLFCKGSSSHCKKSDNSQTHRMQQYERALETDSEIPFVKKQAVERCEEERKRLRKQILKLIDSGSEMTQFQARQTFSLYLETILRRLTQEPKDSHEKIILKFLSRYGGAAKPPVLFRNPQSTKVINKARSAMVAKLLGDFLELYRRDTEAYVDSFDHFGMIPGNMFGEFLSQAQEADLADVLTLHTSMTGIMPYLYNRCGLSVPPTPPIPSGSHGFLRALPAMVSSSAACARELCKYDGYFKNYERDYDQLPDVALRASQRSTRKY